MIKSEVTASGVGQGVARVKPKSTQTAIRYVLGALSMGVLAACGGEGGGGLGVADGGIRGTGSSVGPVSGFGSVFVNGVEFATDNILNKLVISDDGITQESDLSEGMILRVEGEWQDDGLGTAESLSYDDTLRGPITQLAADPSGAGEFVTVSVMGQPVRVNRQTVARGTTFANLLAGTGMGQNVRVSAWRQTDGSYRAGYIGVLSAAPVAVELEGSVSGVDIDGNEFTIGDITVQYPDDVDFGSGLTEEDLPSANVLEVEGTLVGNLLTATSIDRDDARRFAREGAEDVQLTATIDASYVADGGASRPGEFTMGGLTVRVTATTELGDGLSLSDLRTDLLVQIEGNFVSDTVIEAEEIELREGESEVQGPISVNSVDVSENTFRVGGVLVQVTSLTAIVGDDDINLGLQNLGGPEQVEVSGIERVNSGGDVYLEAFEVEIGDEESDDPFELVGRVRSVDASEINVLGVSISFDSETDFNGITLMDLQNSEEPLVEVKYVESSSGIFLADEIELE